MLLKKMGCFVLIYCLFLVGCSSEIYSTYTSYSSYKHYKLSHPAFFVQVSSGSTGLFSSHGNIKNLVLSPGSLFNNEYVQSDMYLPTQEAYLANSAFWNKWHAIGNSRYRILGLIKTGTKYHSVTKSEKQTEVVLDGGRFKTLTAVILR